MRVVDSRFLFSFAFCVACTSSDPAGPPAADSGPHPEAASAAGSASAGTCVGTQCDPVTPEPVAQLTPTQCTLKTAAPARVVWNTELGEVECNVGRCRLINPDIAVAPDGSLWAAADLDTVPPNPPSFVPLGRAIAHFEAQGKRLS